MHKKYLALVLSVMLINLACAGPVWAKASADKEARLAAKVKASVLAFGTGPAARVKVKLRDKTKLEGYVSVTGEDSFVVTDTKTGVATTVPYPQVKQVKGNNLSTGAKIAIGVGIGIGVLLLVVLIKCRGNDFCN